MRIYLVVLLVFVLSACASEPLIKQTVSGNAEAVFKDTSIEEVRSKLVASCSMRGLMVEESSNNRVICGKTLTGGNAVIASLTVGTKYSTDPVHKASFVLFSTGSDTMVVATQWIESQTAYGQTRRQELTSNKQKNDLQSFLFSLGAR